MSIAWQRTYLVWQFFLLFEYQIVVVLTPPDMRAESSKLPDTVNFLIPHSARAMSMTLDSNSREGLVRVFLVWHPNLMRANHLIVRHLLPLAEADEMLSLDQGVAQEMRTRCHGHEVGC